MKASLYASWWYTELGVNGDGIPMPSYDTAPCPRLQEAKRLHSKICASLQATSGRGNQLEGEGRFVGE